MFVKGYTTNATNKCGMWHQEKVVDIQKSQKNIPNNSSDASLYHSLLDIWDQDLWLCGWIYEEENHPKIT